MAVLAGLLLVVCVYDAATFLIPNWLNAAILVLYPIFLFALPESGVSGLSGLYGFGIFFIVGFGLFAIGVIGGGDSKLLIALGPWLGMSYTMLNFLLFMSFFGVILSALLLIIRGMIGKDSQEKTPKLFQKKAPIPYGIAIAAAFVMLMGRGDIAGLPGVM